MSAPRRRLTGLLGALAAVTLLSGCGGGGVHAPTEGVARAVPADALAYIHLSLDTSDGAVTQLRSTAAELPGYDRLRRRLEARLSAITGVSFQAQIDPWLGSEAALAFVPEGSSASELIVLGVRNRRLARAFLGEVRGASARLLDGVVVIGEPAVVAGAGTGPSLAGNPAFRRALTSEPSDRVLDAYGTGSGLAELLAGRSGPAAVGAALLASEHPQTVALALAPTGDGARLWVRMTGPALGHSARFDPSLAARLPADTAWVAQIPSLVGSGPGLLAVLAAVTGAGAHSAGSVPGLVAKLAPALSSEGVDPQQLGELFDHPSAIFDLDGDVGVMTRTTDTAEARRELGEAGGALAELFAPGGPGGTQPLVSTQTLDGVPVTTYQQQTGAQFDYAVFRGIIVATTSERAIAAIIDQKAPLSASSLYRSVLAGPGPSAGPVLFGAINRLVRSGDQTGLLQSLDLGSARSALGHISAAGLSSTAGESNTTSELYLTIS